MVYWRHNNTKPMYRNGESSSNWRIQPVDDGSDTVITNEVNTFCCRLTADFKTLQAGAADKVRTLAVSDTGITLREVEK